MITVNHNHNHSLNHVHNNEDETRPCIALSRRKTTPMLRSARSGILHCVSTKTGAQSCCEAKMARRRQRAPPPPNFSPAAPSSSPSSSTRATCALNAIVSTLFTSSPHNQTYLLTGSLGAGGTCTLHDLLQKSAEPLLEARRIREVGGRWHGGGVVDAGRRCLGFWRLVFVVRVWAGVCVCGKGRFKNGVCLFRVGWR